MTRREAAKVIGGTAAGLFLPITTRAANESSSAMLTRTIPSSGEKLPVIGLGTWQAFDVDLTADSRRQLEEVLSLFVKLGGRVIDSSPMYGRAEEIIGDLTATLGIRDKLFLATKVWTHGKESGIKSMERSMALLRTKRIDLMQVHNLVDVHTHLATLREWKEQGRIRYFGITHYEAGAFREMETLCEARNSTSSRSTTRSWSPKRSSRFCRWLASVESRCSPTGHLALAISSTKCVRNRYPIGPLNSIAGRGPNSS